MGKETEIRAQRRKKKVEGEVRVGEG